MLHFVKSFLPHNMGRQVKELFVFTTLINFALALVMIFEPIYLYKIGYGLNEIMIFYFMVYVLYFILAPLGGKFAHYFGYEQSMFVSSVFVAGPVLAGFIVSGWGYGALFTVASVIFLAANIPTLMTSEHLSLPSFPYKKAYSDLFSRENRKSFFGYIGFGEELVVMIIWPIFISIVIADIFDLGLVVTLATLITTLVVVYI